MTDKWLRKFIVCI